MLDSEISSAHFGEYYLITVLWDVRNLTFVVWEKQMMVSTVISEKKFLCFNFEHITPEVNP